MFYFGKKLRSRDPPWHTGLVLVLIYIACVQTLHKNASEFEKEEFLKEALLMSNFKHEHILQMLGVCLNNDPQFIILELMEGGDLLSFLRSSRPTVVSEDEVSFSSCQ